jgi:hypothetical protein
MSPDELVVVPRQQAAGILSRRLAALSIER